MAYHQGSSSVNKSAPVNMQMSAKGLTGVVEWAGLW